MPLNLRQQRFIEAYLAEPNATKAAVAAGYAESSARTTGNKLVNHPDVRAAIDAAMGASAVRAQGHVQRNVVTHERIIDELARVAFSDIRRLTSWSDAGVHLLPADEVDCDTSAAIADITETKSGRETRLSAKMHSKMTALTLLARITGLLDRREPDGAGDAGGIADDADPPHADEDATASSDA